MFREREHVRSPPPDTGDDADDDPIEAVIDDAIKTVTKLCTNTKRMAKHTEAMVARFSATPLAGLVGLAAKCIVPDAEQLDEAWDILRSKLAEVGPAVEQFGRFIADRGDGRHDAEGARVLCTRIGDMRTRAQALRAEFEGMDFATVTSASSGTLIMDMAALYVECTEVGDAIRTFIAPAEAH